MLSKILLLLFISLIAQAEFSVSIEDCTGLHLSSPQDFISNFSTQAT